MTQLKYNETQYVYCHDGKWTEDIHKIKCVLFCRLDRDPSVRYICSGTTCNGLVPSGTLVNPVCSAFYTPESLLYMKCTEGKWNYIAKCKPDCGILTPIGTELIIDGMAATRGELPWHVGVYRKQNNTFLQICGGTLISSSLVISAAHCVWSDVDRTVQPARTFYVTAGKLYRSWDDLRDYIDKQVTDVREIRVPSLFDGSAANFQEDIAVLILDNPFSYTQYVHPVCINFDILFDTLQLQHGNLGKVAGWGLTAANGESSEFLKTVHMPFISEGICIKTLPQSFRPYITGDKFCAGYTNGTALCRGDSGGGIVFSEKEQGVERFYLRGVVSTAPNVKDKKCNDKSYTTFTRVRKHEELIKRALAETAESCLPGTVKCDDGTCRQLPEDYDLDGPCFLT